MTVLVAGIALGASNAWSQELPFVEYRVDSEINPLPSASISDVFRDRHGYLWLVVYSSGLVRYDGHDMVQYDTSDGLPSNLVVEAVEDGKGHLWVSTRKGIAVSEKALGDYPAGKRIEFTTSFGGTKLASTDLKAESLAVDGGGRLWIGLSGAVLRYSHGPNGLETKRVVLEPASLPSAGHDVVDARGDASAAGHGDRPHPERAQRDPGARARSRLRPAHGRARAMGHWGGRGAPESAFRPVIGARQVADHGRARVRDPRTDQRHRASTEWP